MVMPYFLTAGFFSKNRLKFKTLMPKTYFLIRNRR
jgi:hypothetical protein